MSIPKPLVQVNQVFLIVFVLLSWLISPLLFLFPLVVGIIALAFRRNIIMRAFTPSLKRPAREYVQEDAAQQRFNQWIATICLAVAFISYSFGFEVIMYIMSGMVVLAAALALSGYCIGCTIRYRYMMWKYNRKNSHSN
ncbi:DUF4395 domain-containing protein [Alkalihalophilus marmarensis]|jgi:cobalamin synthase|uniref:DUF4395 domain-containing protein n=1 Tax=Alkalihalophilus marmarensis DSM 21297 TaxID=1188261 RepID=U6SPM3_9BACI|nr:DUF4395 domain-containing protein [Alkalihalophilus marmarensis]ERN53568.1 hypothetical protein A33I_11080 [Alkalihalophilus marmarensis DSM 21297]MCM3490054.1 DUF4395 domain-containing protein [Alkalihalophilus marmarensis]